MVNRRRRQVKIPAEVTGHKLVKRADHRMVRVELTGTGVDPMKIQLTVAEEDRAKYPYGATAVVNFDVQQEMALEAGRKSNGKDKAARTGPVAVAP